MPTYGYRCEKCGHTFEVLQRMTDEAGASCPACGAAARRLFYPTGIVFKGSGFYVTDSRKAATDGSASSSTSTGDGAAAKDGAAVKKESTSKAAPSTSTTPSDTAS
jgi:putative FmdB family regulatory protein